MTAEDINLAREWLATVAPTNGEELPPEMQAILDTIEESLEIAMEATILGQTADGLCALANLSGAKNAN